MPELERYTTEAAPADLMRAARRLMIDAFDGDFSDDDWDHALGGTHVVAVDDGELIAHAAVVPRSLEIDDRPFRAGYVEAVATAPARQGEGVGTELMGEVAEVVVAAFELGALATGEHRFYERLGWERWRGPTSVRAGEQLIRTPDDDDGIMVLRFGPSATVDLDASIVCHMRSGDVW